MATEAAAAAVDRQRPLEPAAAAVAAADAAAADAAAASACDLLGAIQILCRA